MKNQVNLISRKSQTAVEYLLLLAAMVVIVLIGMQVFLPRAHDSSELYFNRVSLGIVGNPPRCGDGICQENYETWLNCCVDDCVGANGEIGCPGIGAFFP